MMRKLALVLVVLLLMPSLQVSATGSNEWPQFRADSSNTGSTQGLAPMVGGVVWSYSIAERIKSSPTVADGKLFIGDSSGMIWALDAETGDFLWNHETGGSVESTPTFVDGTIYVGSNDKKLYALNADDGTLKWTFETNGVIKSSVSTVSPEDSGGELLLVFGSYDNRVYALDTNGNESWQFSSKSFIHSKPSIADGLAFSSSCDKTLYGVDVTSGKLVWNVTLDDYSGVSPSAINGTVFAAGRGGKVVSVDIGTGGTNWGYQAKGLVEASPAVGEGKVFIGTKDGEMNALDIATGNRSWLYRARNQIISSPALVDGTLFFGDSDMVLHALQASDGRELWNFTADGEIESSPAVAYGKVYFGTLLGMVYALGDSKPSVKIGLPLEWDKVRGKFDIEVEVFGSDISLVEVSLDGKKWKTAIHGTDPNVWTAKLDSKVFKNGERELLAKATNATGEGTDTIFIVIKNKKVEPGFIPGFGAFMLILATVVATLVVSRSKPWR